MNRKFILFLCFFNLHTIGTLSCEFEIVNVKDIKDNMDCKLFAERLYVCSKIRSVLYDKNNYKYEYVTYNGRRLNQVKKTQINPNYPFYNAKYDDTIYNVIPQIVCD